MQKIIIISLLLVLILGAGFIIYRVNFRQNFSKYEYLKQPQISTMKNQKMIEIKSTGDPNTNAGKVIGRLFSTYFKLKNNRSKMAAPRARWPIEVEVSKEKWYGFYGLPVSDSVTELPLPKQKEQPELQLVNWEYGTVAEILHIGPYSTETPTIERLKKFITDNGYQIVGDHEEEYLKGPGLWPTNSKHYYTIIRYRILKK